MRHSRAPECRGLDRHCVDDKSALARLRSGFGTRGFFRSLSGRFLDAECDWGYDRCRPARANSNAGCDRRLVVSSGEWRKMRRPTANSVVPGSQLNKRSQSHPVVWVATR